MAANTYTLTLLRHQVAEAVVQVSAREIGLVAPLERHVLYGLLLGWSQQELARDLGLSQPTISYRRDRALHRLAVLAEYPKFTLPQARRVVRATGFAPKTGAGQDAFVEAMAQLVVSTNQSVAAEKVGMSQGWVRYQFTKLHDHLEARTDERHDLLLRALTMIVEHGTIRPWAALDPDGSYEPSPSGKEVLAQARRVISTPLPPPPTRRWHRPVPDEHVQVVVDLLRENGPQPRAAVAEVLARQGLDADRVLRAASMRGRVVRRQGPRRGTVAPSVLHLLAPAATTVEDGLVLCWDDVVHDYCHAYDRFKTRDLLRHLGVVQQDHRSLRESTRVLAELVRAEGFRETPPGTWSRRRIRKA